MLKVQAFLDFLRKYNVLVSVEIEHAKNIVSYRLIYGSRDVDFLNFMDYGVPFSFIQEICIALENFEALEALAEYKK